MIVNSTGKNLDVLINTQTADDWKAFSTWYSVIKNLPDANVILVCNKNQKIEFQFFQWAKRLNIKHFYQTDGEPFVAKIRALVTAIERKMLFNKVLVLDACAMITEPLNENLLKLVNANEHHLIIDDSAWLVNSLSKSVLEDIWNNYGLNGEHGIKILNYQICINAKDNIDSPISSFKKGCGKWIDTMKGCPFSSAAGMVADDMTVNELRIIELWKRMVPLYSAVL